jgi:Na+/alanine symporter
MSYVNLLIVLVLCSVVGAFTGLVLGDLVGQLYLAIIAGVLATIIAVVARNVRIPQLVVIYSALAIEHPVPKGVISYSIITSFIAGAAAIGVATIAGWTTAITIGALGGFFAGLLMAMLVMAYDQDRGETT